MQSRTEKNTEMTIGLVRSVTKGAEGRKKISGSGQGARVCVGLERGPSKGQVSGGKGKGKGKGLEVYMCSCSLPATSL